MNCAFVLHHLIRAGLLAGDDAFVLLEDVRQRNFVAAAGFGGT